MRGCDAFDFGAVYAIDFGAQRVAFGFDFAHRSAAIGGFAAQARDFAFVPSAFTVKGPGASASPASPAGGFTSCRETSSASAIGHSSWCWWPCSAAKMMAAGSSAAMSAKVQVTVIKLRHDPRDCVGAEPRRDGTAKVHVHLAVAGLHVQSSQRGRVV
jgi:hypothetical protein